jgi:hypothetical protein
VLLDRQLVHSKPILTMRAMHTVTDGNGDGAGAGKADRYISALIG